MTSYRTSDGQTVKTENARASWEEGNHRSKLYCTRKGRYYKIENHIAEWLDNRAAVRWLFLYEHDMPEDLQPLAEKMRKEGYCDNANSNRLE